MREVFRYLAMINGMLAAFNLLPGFPLDGGRILRAFLWSRTGSIGRATSRAMRSGALIAMVFGMPREAIKLGAADEVMPLQSIPRGIMSHWQSQEKGMGEAFESGVASYKQSKA